MHMLLAHKASSGSTNRDTYAQYQKNHPQWKKRDFSLEWPLKVFSHYNVLQRVKLGHTGGPLMCLALKKTQTDSLSAPLTASDPH